MSVSLLAPWALAAAGLLAIPVILHLFKPRRVRRTPFSSLRWLRLSPQKLSRRIQWHQVLLFLLRAAFLTLLVLALARPLLTRGDQGRPLERFIVLDVSHSMNYRASSQATPFDRARELAIELLRRNRPGDRTAVLLCGTHTRLLTPLSSEPETFLPAVQAVQPGLGGTDLGSALPVIRGLLARARPNADVAIWFLTDNQQHAWAQGAPADLLKDLPAATRVQIVDVGVPGAQNAWISRARFLKLSNPTRQVFRIEVGCVGDATQERTVIMDAFPPGGPGGSPERSQPVILTPGRTAVVDFEMPPGSGMLGLPRFHLDPPDALPGDDEALVNLYTPGTLRVLLVGSSGEAHQPGFHLRSALEALGDASGEPLQLVLRAAADVQPQDFQQADIVFLMDVPELPDACLAALEDRVRAGAGLGLFLGEAGKPGFLNEKLYKPLQPDQGLLPAPVRRETSETGEALLPLTGVQWTHPLLAGLGDPVLGDLSLTRFRQWYRFTAELPAGDIVLARIDDDVPALLERNFGAGKVVVFNTGGGDRWSDLARRNCFLPLIDRTLNYLGAGGARRTFAVGELVTLALPGWQPGEAVSVTSPGGQRLTPPVRGLPGGRAMLSFEAVESGPYKVERGVPGMTGITVLAQAARADSVLGPMDPAILKQWWAPLSCDIVRGDDLPRHLDASGASFGLWPTLLLLAGLVLLVEMYFVHRLTPQVNPKLVQNIVGRRGLVRPTTSE